jgi:hypothetical protein
MNDTEARRALATLLEDAPAVTFTSADLLRAGRTRRRRAVALVSAGVAVVLAATPVALRALPSTGSAVGQAAQAGLVAHDPTGFPRLVRPARCVTGSLDDQRARDAVRELSVVLRGSSDVPPLDNYSTLDQYCPAGRGVERSVTAKFVVPEAFPGQHLRAAMYLTATPNQGQLAGIPVGTATLPDGRRVPVTMASGAADEPSTMWFLTVKYSPYLWATVTLLKKQGVQPPFPLGSVAEALRWAADPRLLEVAELAAR